MCQRFLLNRLATALLVASSLGLPLGARAASYSVTTLDMPGASYTQVFGINNAGQIVGDFASANGDGTLQSFVMQNGIYTALTGPTGSATSTAMGISDAGVVAGSYNPSAGVDANGNPLFGPQAGYLYANGSYTVFQLPGYAYTELRGISSDGRYLSGFVGNDAGGFQGFAFDRNTNSLTIVGAADGHSFVLAHGINNHGTLVGDVEIYSDDFSSETLTGFSYDLTTQQQTRSCWGPLRRRCEASTTRAWSLASTMTSAARPFHSPVRRRATR